MNYILLKAFITLVSSTYPVCVIETKISLDPQQLIYQINAFSYEIHTEIKLMLLQMLEPTSKLENEIKIQVKCDNFMVLKVDTNIVVDANNECFANELNYQLHQIKQRIAIGVSQRLLSTPQFCSQRIINPSQSIKVPLKAIISTPQSGLSDCIFNENINLHPKNLIHQIKAFSEKIRAQNEKKLWEMVGMNGALDSNINILIECDDWHMSFTQKIVMPANENKKGLIIVGKTFELSQQIQAEICHEVVCLPQFRNLRISPHSKQS